MPVRPAATRDLFARVCEFPAERDAVVAKLGSVRLSAADRQTTVGSVLDRSDRTTFESATHLHSTLMTHLDADHVGRTRYDDRGGNPVRDDAVSL